MRSAAFILLLWLAIPVSAADPPAVIALDSLALSDSHGKAIPPATWKNEFVVLFFIDTECPVSKFYSVRMQELANKYAGKVAVIGVFSDPNLTAEDVNAFARDYKLAFPLILDPEQKLAKPLGIRVVPEAAVLNRKGEREYRGRIDDQITETGKRRLQASRHDLDDTLTSLLAHKPLAVRETVGFGCPLPAPKSSKTRNADKE